jgi:glycosyltransferase involved in cell wall biosynthesis
MYSIVVCLLNEIDNIEDLMETLKSNHPTEIIVVDGGSVDGTLDLISNYPEVRLFSLKNRGLLAQRLLGVKESLTEVIVFVDADDRFKEGEIDRLFLEFIKSGADGMQMRLRAFMPFTYWERGWDVYFKIITNPNKILPILGRPCVTFRKYFNNIDSVDGVFCEDTYLLEAQKLHYGNLLYLVSKSESSRKCLSKWSDNFKQFYKYGVSDLDVASKYCNHFQLIFHYLARIAIFRSFKAILNGDWKYVPFIFLMGIIRFYGFTLNLGSKILDRNDT